MKYADLHCDTITECFQKGIQLESNNLHISVKKAQKYQPWVQFFAVWIPDDLRGNAAEARFKSVYDTFLNQMKLNSGSIAWCGNAGQLNKAVSEQKNAAFLSIEGSAALNGSIEKLHEYSDLGVRMITLTWNGHCEAGDGCITPDAGGLTPFGKELVREMASLHVITDVSHLSDRGFDDVASETELPFVASHSNSRAVCGNPRNLTDAQFGEIVRRGGLVGLNLFKKFIKDDKDADYRDLIPHVEHFLELGGEDVLAVGADFDGSSMPHGIDGIQDVSKIYEALLEYYPERVLDKIFYQNTVHFLNCALTANKNCYNIKDI